MLHLVHKCEQMDGTDYMIVAILRMATIIMNNRHINDTIDTYKDMYKYFRHQPAT